MKKILIVDDEEDVREVIFDFLQGRGFDVLTAKDGQEALSILKNNKFDIIVTDMKMPLMRGDRFIQEAKMIPELKAKIILMTGGGEWEIENQAIALADFHLHKPFEFKAFLDLIDKAST